MNSPLLTGRFQSAAFAFLILATLAAPITLSAHGSTNKGSKTHRNPAKTHLANGRTYLGFDRNKYPGDFALPLLRKTFSFSGYWLNNPPGETTNTWHDRRRILISNGFGFVVLYNGRLARELKSETRAINLGRRDAAAAVNAAKREGFAPETIVFLDQEEGGRLTSMQRAYVFSWIDGVNASGYSAGLYCSGIPAREEGGARVVTSDDVKDHAGSRRIVFFVYNDACPPSPGCDAGQNPPAPQSSGVTYATVWQFAQSPRRENLTAACRSHYDPDGNCYAPLLFGRPRVFVDLDSATSPDPSDGGH